MSRSHRIWVDVSGGSGKSFGCGQDGTIRMDVQVGSGPSNSKTLATIVIRQSEWDNQLTFSINIDGQEYRREEFDRKSREFKGIEGCKIDGSLRAEKKRQQQRDNDLLKSVGMIARMGEIFGNTDKEKNDWKKRMLQAGLGDRGLIMPEDWDTLSEEDKQKRLDGAIDALTDKGE